MHDDLSRQGGSVNNTPGATSPGDGASILGGVRALLFSAALVGVVTAIKSLVPPLGPQVPFVMYFGAVLAASWYGGRGAGMVTTLLSAFVANGLFLPPQGGLSSTPAALVQSAVFVLECVSIVLLVHAARATQTRLAQLQRVATILSGARTPEEIARIAIEQGCDILGAEASIVVRARDDEGIDVLAERPSPRLSRNPLELPAELDSHPVLVALRSNEAAWIETEQEHAVRYPDFTRSTQGAFGSTIALPLHGGTELRAALAFHFAASHNFNRRVRALMLSLADQVTQALRRASLYANEVAARRSLEALSDLATALSTTSDRAEVAAVVVERGMLAAGADTCTLYVTDERDGSLELIGDRGVATGVLERIRHLPHDPDNPTFRAFQKGVPIWAETEEQYHAFYPALAHMQTSGPRAKAFWCVPLVVENVPIGLLGMGFYEPRKFPTSDRAFVETFTRQCAQALQRAQRSQGEREARGASEQARSSLAATLRSIGDAVIATDLAGNVTFMNPVAETLTGWNEPAARGQPLKVVFRIVNEATRQEVESPVDKVLREGTVVGLANHTVLIARNSAGETPIDDSGAPIRDDAGTVQGVILVFRSASEEKKQEARRAFLGEASGTLASSLDYRQTLSRVAALAVPQLADWCAIDIVDPGQSVPERIAVAHIDPKKVALAHDLQRRYPTDPNAPTGVPNVIRTGVAEFYPEISDDLLVKGAIDEEHLRISRELHLRSALVVPLRVRSRTLGAITLVYADSERRYTEEELDFALDFASRAAIAIENSQLYASEQREREKADVANRAKDEFLASISHELRTPLNAILGWAHMLAESNLSPEKQRRAIQVVERNATSMAQLIEDLLDVSRIVSGKMRLNISAIDLTLILDSALDSVRPAADAKEIGIHRQVEPGLGMVMADSTRLQQVVWNLASNAVKFTPQGGRIDIVVRRFEAGIELAVTDTGRGIDPRFLPHVFEAFRQADGTIARAHGGLGLGLAITRHLVELHGGRIEARSEGEGCGATFVVRLPLATGRKPSKESLGAEGGRRKVSPGHPVELNDLRVLVVDDEDDARMLVLEILEQCGAHVTSARSAREALQAFEQAPPDVLLSDIGMPGESGYDLIRKVRALPSSRGGNVPAAALTAYARPEDRRAVLDAGYAVHVSKPIDPNELVNVVARLARARVG